MFAIVDIAGFQELVRRGDRLQVPLLGKSEGETVLFEKVLLLADGEALTLGSPFVSGASVETKILSVGKGEKVRLVKAHRRKRYRRTKGHRQGYNVVEVVGVTGK